MAKLKSRELTDLLLCTIPELVPVYEEKKEFSGKRYGAHVVYGDILNPYLFWLLCNQGDGHQAILHRIFALLERLATDDNLHVREVVRVTVCERLGDDRQVLAAARQYMGPTTLRLSQDVEQQWGRE